jgi:dynein heavy chain 2
LEILGQSQNATVIQAHLKKLFQGIHSVHFDTTEKNIIAMQSLEGEVVTLKRSVKVLPDVGVWLMALAKEMKATLKEMLISCSKEKTLDPANYPSQVGRPSTIVIMCAYCRYFVCLKNFASLPNVKPPYNQVHCRH